MHVAAYTNTAGKELFTSIFLATQNRLDPARIAPHLEQRLAVIASNFHSHSRLAHAHCKGRLAVRRAENDQPKAQYPLAVQLRCRPLDGLLERLKPPFDVLQRLFGL